MKILELDSPYIHYKIKDEQTKHKASYVTMYKNLLQVNVGCSNNLDSNPLDYIYGIKIS